MSYHAWDPAWSLALMPSFHLGSLGAEGRKTVVQHEADQARTLEQGYSPRRYGERPDYDQPFPGSKNGLSPVIVTRSIARIAGQ